MDCVKRQIHNSRRNDSLVMTGIGMAAAATLGVYAFNTITKKDNIDPNRQIISQKGWLSDLFARNFYDGPFQGRICRINYSISNIFTYIDRENDEERGCSYIR